MRIGNKKGAALIWAVVFCSALILISTTITGYILKDSRFSYKIGESYNVYAAAKSGIAWGQKYVDLKGGPGNLAPHPDTGDQTFNIEGITVSVIVVKSYSGEDSICPDDEFLYCIESLASDTVSNITRKMTSSARKFDYDQKITTSYDRFGNGDNVFYEGNESFGIQFDFWGDDVLTDWVLGVADPESGGEIYVKFSDDGIRLAAKHPDEDEEIQSIGKIEIEEGEINESFKFRANLDYVKNTSAILTIRENVTEPVFGLVCVAQISLNLASMNFGDFKNIRTIDQFEKINLDDYSAVFKSTIPDREIYLSNIDIRSMKVRDYSESSVAVVTIGSQVWMRDNINVGTMIDGADNQSLDQKYCYDDSLSNCTTYGGLYQWNTAMNGSSTPRSRGICPIGFHIPTDEELYTLESYYATSACSSTRTGSSCLPAGRLLQDGPFDFKISGARSSGGTFGSPTDGFIWSSSNGWIRYVSSSFGNPVDDIYRFQYLNTSGFSVRCIKD